MSESKKFDNDKLPMGLTDPEFDKALAEVLQFGAKKYAPESWKKLEGAEQRYMDALLRHINAHRRGEYADSESGLSHLAHAACNLMFLMYFEREAHKTRLTEEERKALQEAVKSFQKAKGL